MKKTVKIVAGVVAMGAATALYAGQPAKPSLESKSRMVCVCEPGQSRCNCEVVGVDENGNVIL